MILSTGMNSILEIEHAVDILERKNVPYALLHCTNLYPTKPDQVRLGAMVQMMEHFKDIPIGLSDHTLNNFSCIAAISLGATIVERHFTDNMNRVGNDIVCSMDEHHLKELLLAAEEIPIMLGGKKEALKDEKITSDFAFATVVAIKNIKKGELFSKENIWVKRPGTGQILAKDYDNVLGRNASCDIICDSHITWDMVE